MQFPPKKKRKYPLANKSKYCKFHQDYGHDTNVYVTLRDEIETLIKKGKLAKYKQYRGRKEEEKKECERSHSLGWRDVGGRSGQAEQHILGMVEKILGGFAGGRKLNNAKKRHLKVVLNAKNKK